MDSIDADDFLAGLAPPSITTAVRSPSRSHTDDALPRTPSMPNTPGGSAVGRKPVADATSTLLNFLKQEQALVSEHTHRPSSGQQQPLSHKASTALEKDSKALPVNLAPSPVGKGVRWSSSEPDESAALSNTSNQQQAAASSSSNSQALPSSALPADTKSAPSSPFKQLGSAAVPNSLGNPAAAGGHAGLVTPASEGVPTGRVSALRQQLEATATTTTVPAVSGRRAAPKASTQPAPSAAVAATKQTVKHSDSWELDADMLPDSSTMKHTAGGATHTREEDAGGSSYMPSLAGSSSKFGSNRSRIGADYAGASVTPGVNSHAAADNPSTSRPGLPNPTQAAADPAVSQKQQSSQEDTERQQIASQMAAALARRAQLSQQQATPASSNSNSSAARTAGTRSVTPVDGAASQLSESPLSTTSNRSADMTAAAAGAFGLGTAGLTSVSPSVSPPGVSAGAVAAGTSAPAPATSTVFSASGGVAAGGLLARGLADLGIIDTPAASGPQGLNNSSMISSGVHSVPDVVEQQRATSSSGLPPGVVPLSGKSGAAVSTVVRGTSGSVSSAATAAAILSTMTSAGPAFAAAAVEIQQERQQQTVTLQQLQQPTPWQQPEHQHPLPQQPAVQTPPPLSTPQLPQQQQQPQQQVSPQQQPSLPAASNLQHSALPAGGFESQLSNVRQLASLQQELADQRLTIARLRQEADEEHARHQAEIGRLRIDLDAAHHKAAADAAAARDNMAQEIAAAEARAQRSAFLERDIALAQLQAQTAAIAQEREALAAQRVNTDVLANLSEQVRDAAAATAERESRALAALEKSTAERAAAIAARERRLQEREEAASSRERELDELKSQLGKVLAGLEDQAAADKRVMEAQTARLARESARLEALQAALLTEREETKLAVTQEKQALEEARAARIKEREAFIAEMTAERRRLAEESAATARAAEEARANLLDLKGRVAEYEATAAAALRQAREEEARASAAREKIKGEQEKLAAAQKDVQAASRKVDEDRAQLQAWGARLATLTREFDAAKEEVKAARTEIQTQRGTLATQVTAVMAAQEELELQRDVILKARVDLDRQRVLIAEERAALSRERIAASQAATGHRPHTGIVHTTAHCIAGPLNTNTHTPRRPHTAPCEVDDVAAAAADNRQQVLGNTMGSRSLGAGKNVLRKLLEELQVDHQADRGTEGSMKRSRGWSKVVIEQRSFLDQLKAATRQNSSLYGGSQVALGSLSGADVQQFRTTGWRDSSTAAGDAFSALHGLLSSPVRRSGAMARDSSVAAAAMGTVIPGLLHTMTAAGGAATAPAFDTQLLLQQLAQTQQDAVAQPTASVDNKHSKPRSSSKRSSKLHKQSAAQGDLLSQQLRAHNKLNNQEQKKHKRSSASRVSSDLSQLIALSVTDSSDTEEVVNFSSPDDPEGMQQLTDSSNS